MSLAKLEPTGQPFRVSDVGAYPSAAADGTIAYSLTTWNRYARWQLTWVERSGKVLNRVGPPLPGLSEPRLSPDQRRVVAVAGESTSEEDIWLFDLAGGGTLPLTRTLGAKIAPRWWNGGQTIVFTRFGEGSSQVLSISVDGTTPAQRLFEGRGAISDSGKFLLGSEKSANGVTRGFIRMEDLQRKFVAFPQAVQDMSGASLSPDDRLLSYHSNESGQFEVYAVEFPSFTNKTIASRGGGQHPQWHPNGKELFYFGGDGRTLMTRKLGSDGTLDEPSKIFDVPESIQGSVPWFGSPYAVAQDGNLFLMLKKPEDEPTTESATKPNVRVVMNWFEEFREKK